ncbi:hypothetical protein U4E84_06870 [Halorubrum sp. AD140]|uniref:DUF7500 family protein n=1 Tax=Halorubrum sp. AD140 TaxID=3050073 RepID=UPI002ACC943C|nr:hypothetical protein [Halorubrum sp. AD140]MDZ5811065.1 hypothetical protein [Halorubrum sp. AD140]
MSDHDAPAGDPDAPPVDPEDLDFTDDESVVEIGESRYVVGTNGRPNVGRSRPEGRAVDESGFTAAEPASPAERRPAGADPRANASGPDVAGENARGGGDAEVDRQAVSRWLATSFDGDGFTYGIDATLHVDGDTTRQRMVSNDVTATFDALVTWFASNAGPSSPTPEALGLLLVASETTVDVPPVAIKRFAASHGLTASDSIGDLVRAAEEADGFRIE